MVNGQKDNSGDDSLGVVFKSSDNRERAGLNMNAPLRGGGGARKSKSILSNTEDIFDIGHAFKGSGEVEKGTIVTDKRHVHIGIGETLTGAFREWYTKTSTTLKNVEFLKKKEPETMAAPETRKEIIKEAATFTKQVPKDDHTIIVEKLRTLNQDAERITGRPFLLKKTDGDTPPEKPEREEKPATRAPSYGDAGKLHTYKKEKNTLDLRNVAIAPTVERGAGGSATEYVGVLADVVESEIPLIKTLKREGPVVGQRPAELPEKKMFGPIPENLPGVVHANTVESEKTNAENGWSFLLKEVEDAPKPVNVSVPEWDTEKRVSEVLSNPVPDPEEIARVNREKAEKEAIMHAEEERVRREQAEIEELRRIERLRVAREQADAEAARRAEAAELRAAQSNVMKSLHREREVGPKEVQPSVGLFLVRLIVQKLTDISTRTILISIAVILGGVAGVGVALFVAHNATEVSKNAPVSLIPVDAQVEATLGTSRTPFMESVARAVQEAPGGAANILIRETSGTELTPETFFETLDATVSGSFVRALDTRMMVGSVTVGKNEPFIIFHSNSFDSAFAGMLDWESLMQTDLAPLFGERSETETTKSAAVPFSKSSFVDATAENNSIRILRDSAGNERIVYAFVNRSTIIITASTEALAAILLRIP